MTDGQQVMPAEEDRNCHARERDERSIYECEKCQQTCFDHASGAS
jgi:hypothetical protein